MFIFSVFDPLIFQVFWPACCLTSLRVGGFIGGALEEVVRLDLTSLTSGFTAGVH